MDEKILILGGTREAAQLAAELTAAGHNVTTSLAGRTREPAPLEGNTRIGGFGGAQGLADYLAHEKIDRLIDATHPFARQISKNARAAAELTGTPLEIRSRAPWQKMPGDDWIEVASLADARDAIPAGARVFLALGHQHISLFDERADVHFVVRMVDRPDKPLDLADHVLITGTPGDLAAEQHLLRENAISHIVCRNSGGQGAYAKIEAARQLGLPVIMISR